MIKIKSCGAQLDQRQGSRSFSIYHFIIRYRS